MNVHFKNENEIHLNMEYNQEISLKNSDLFVKYYTEYYGQSFLEMSFFVFLDDDIVGYVACCRLEGKLCKPGGGVEIYLFSENNEMKSKLYSKVAAHLEILAKENECQEIKIKDAFVNGQLSFLGEWLFNSKYKANITFEMIVNYKNFSESNYHQCLRRRYKSFVNWGHKHLDFTYLNNQNLDLNLFQEFKQFHYKISGRQTRSDRTWLLQYEMLQKGSGELILASLDGNLVAGALFLDQENTSIYSTGVYERDLFNYGLSHCLIYQGICRSYLRGTTYFSLGYFDTDILDIKWYNIQFFKKGFCESLVPTVLWSKLINKGETNE